jgi:hypothetical protein
LCATSRAKRLQQIIQPSRFIHRMCLWSLQFPHHNTIMVDKEEDLVPFRLVIPAQQRKIVLAPYFPHHNKIMVRGNTSKASDSEPIGFGNEYTDDNVKEKFGDFKHWLRKAILKQKAGNIIDREKLLMVQDCAL